MRQLVFLLFLYLTLASAQHTFPGQDETAVKEDIKFIRCGVCEALAKNAHRQVKAMREDLGPGKKLSEIAIIERLEKITNPELDEGEWMAKIDLVEQGDKLTLAEKDQVGVCGRECKTIQKAAEEVMGDLDTDLGEVLWRGDAGRAAVTKWLCREATSACTKPARPLPAGRKPGPDFKAVDPEELKMQRMMASMQGMGMKGSLFNREEAKRMVGDTEDDEDDDEDDTASGPQSGVGGLLNNLQQKAADVSQGVLGAVAKAKDSVSAAINKLKPDTTVRHVEL